MQNIDYDVRDNSIQYTFKKTNETYSGNFSICPDPVCSCSLIDILFNTKEGQLLFPKVEICLNLKERSVSPAKEGNHNFILAERLFDDLEIQDWDVFTKLYVERKNFYTNNSDFHSLNLTFPIKEIEREGELVSFSGIFPFANLIHFNISDTSLLVEDLHCVLPFCKCKDVHLFFRPFDNAPVLFPFENESPQTTYIIYNVKKKNWHLEEQTGMSFKPGAIMDSFIAAHDIQQLYNYRHKTIRSLYKSYRTQNWETETQILPEKVGRNAPCPCGSGKKYKKCCLLKNN